MDYSILCDSLLYGGFFGMVYYFNTKRLVKLGEKKEKAKRCSSYLNSFIHAFSVTGIGLATLYEIGSGIHNINAISNVYKGFAPMTIGYFIQDTLHLLSEYKKIKQNLPYFFHHILFGSALYWILTLDNYHGLAGIMALTELSTIFLDLFQYYKYKMDKSDHYFFRKGLTVSFYLFGSSFFLTRILGLSYTLYYFMNQIRAQKPVLGLIIGTSLALNSVWMYKIMKLFQKGLDKKIDQKNQ